MVLAACSLFLGALPASAPSVTSIPSSTAIPVRFVRTIDVNRAHSGDPVMARTLQVVILPNGQRLPQGTLVVGHIVQAIPSRSGSRMSGLTPSYLSVHFDRIKLANGDIPVALCVRALANPIASYDATVPYSAQEPDNSGTRTLIGGDEFSPWDGTIQDTSGGVVGVNRRDGPFARLLPAADLTSGDSHDCTGTNTEQAVATFSPEACGIYGYGDTTMPDAGRDGSGQFTLYSKAGPVRLYAGSTALLQQI